MEAHHLHALADGGDADGVGVPLWGAHHLRVALKDVDPDDRDAQIAAFRDLMADSLKDA